jgi:flagellin
MRINTNTASLNAQVNAANTNKTLTNSLEKLSSGLRINKAADDASGMAIADKLRTQASSLGQGIANANSGTALIQIADKAMSEQSNILDTVKTKLIQASTSTTSDNGREAIRKDIQKLLNQIDNISEQTTYNGINLLDKKGAEFSFSVGEKASDQIGFTTAYAVNTSGLGSAGAEGTTKANLQLTASAITFEGEASDISATLQSTVGGVSLSGTVVATTALVGDSSFTISAEDVKGFTITSSAAGGVTLNTSDKELMAILDKQANKSTSDALTKISEGQYTLVSTADTTAAVIAFDNDVMVDITDLKVSGLTSGTSAGTSDVLGIMTAEKVDIHKTSGIRDVDVSGITTAGAVSNNFDMEIGSETAGGIDFKTNSTVLKDGTMSVKSDTAANTHISINDSNAGTGTKQEDLAFTVAADNVKSLTLLMTAGTASVTLRSTDAATVSALDDKVGANLTKNLDGSYTLFSAKANEGVTLDFSESPIDIGSLSFEGVQKGTAAGDSEAIFIETTGNVNITNDNKSTAKDTGDIVLSTANTVDTTAATNAASLVAETVDPGMAFQNLEGLLSLDEGELTAEMAKNFMSVIDDAITQLNTVRSDFGSSQNQLEVATRAMMVTQVNIKNAESVIRDTDYASESATFNKQNIIAQAGTYAMSQANAMAQNVQRLLQ